VSERPYRVEQLGPRHDRASFTCGVEPLDRYLHQQARQNVEQRVAAVFVLVSGDSGKLAGYYTLSSGVVLLTDLPPDIATRLPRYPQVPVILLGRLAIALDRQGQGLGEVLLIDALRRAYQQSNQVGAMAVVVDAKDDRARSFYVRLGSRQLADDPNRLFLPMRTIEQLGQPAGEKR
jgi:GNAT superfamily N-acetyltransferase